jgi:hypothetical protein
MLEGVKAPESSGKRATSVPDIFLDWKFAILAPK